MPVTQYSCCSGSDRTGQQKRLPRWQGKPPCLRLPALHPADTQLQAWLFLWSPSAFPQKAPFSQLPHLRLKRRPTPGRKDNRKADRAGEMEDLVLRLHGGPLTPQRINRTPFAFCGMVLATGDTVRAGTVTCSFHIIPFESSPLQKGSGMYL